MRYRVELERRTERGSTYVVEKSDDDAKAIVNNRLLADRICDLLNEEIEQADIHR